NMEEMDKADDIARRLATLAVPHIVLASTNDHEILESLGDLFRGHAFSNLAHESVILSEIRTLVPALSSPSTATDDIARNEPVAGRQDANLRPLILVADDNAINRKLLVTLLMQNDYRVAEAASGEELLELAIRKPWDLALVDIHMPDMNGIEATQKLLARLTGAHPSIIAVSADALPETRASALAAGMRDYLVKPYSEQQLLDMLRRYLESVD
ncbi:MAG: response regulator, partial [Gammaproteobacteria bacterium]